MGAQEGPGTWGPWEGHCLAPRLPLWCHPLPPLSAFPTCFPSAAGPQIFFTCALPELLKNVLLMILYNKVAGQEAAGTLRDSDTLAAGWFQDGSVSRVRREAARSGGDASGGSRARGRVGQEGLVAQDLRRLRSGSR